MNKAQPLPGFTRNDEHDAGERMAMDMIENDGVRYLMIHANGLTTGLVGSEGKLRPAITIWSEPPPHRPIGMALTFTPSDEMLDTIITSLTTLRDGQRREAAELSAALLKKARGK